MRGFRTNIIGGGKHWDGILYDNANGVNLFTSGNMTISGSGINYVSISPSQFEIHASGAGGVNTSAYSNEKFNLKGFTVLRLKGTSNTTIPNYGGYFNFGISSKDAPTTFLKSTSFSLNSESKSFDLSINIENMDLKDVRILFYMSGNYAHYSNLFITKMWLA